jgi:hypothetical protein
MSQAKHARIGIVMLILALVVVSLFPTSATPTQAQDEGRTRR